MNKELIALIRAKFHEKLQARTGWGKNDVMAAYDQVVAEATLELLDKADK